MRDRTALDVSRSVNGSTRQWREVRARILAASDVCHICGQPGADAVDHIVPIARGGTNDPSNLAPAHHDVEPKCNRVKGDRPNANPNRRVILVCGPPGAGKTTHAHTYGLRVMDLDDPEYAGDDILFRAHMALLARDPDAEAVVIRTGATRKARARAASMCGATEVVVLDTPLQTCVARIKARGREPLAYQVNGARKWWSDYEPGSVGLAANIGVLRRSGSLKRPE